MTDTAGGRAPGAGNPQDLAPLRAGLAAVRRRISARAALDALVLGATAALAAYAVLRLATLLSADSGTAVTAAVAVVVAMVVGLAAAAIRLARLPSLTTLARQADSTLAERERLSTALEVAAAPPAGNSVARALMDEVVARTKSLDFGRLAPAAMPQAMPFLLVAAALAGGLALTPVPTRSAIVALASSPTLALDPERRAETGDSLRRIAALLEEDARRRNDPYIGAVAREVARVGEMIARGDPSDLPRLQQALRNAAADAADAYRRAGEPAGGARDLSRLVEAALADAERPAASPDVAAGDAMPPGAEGPAGLPPGAGGAPPRPLEEALAALEARPQSPLQIRQFAGDPGPVDDNNYLTEATPEQIAGQPGPAGPAGPADPNRQYAPAGAELLGAAGEAGRGEGDMAGRGIQPLEGEQGQAFDFGQAEDMLLPDAGGQGLGNRIRLDLPPDGVAAIALAPIPLAPAEGWRRQAETALERPNLPLPARELLARYFTPPPAEAGR